MLDITENDIQSVPKATFLKDYSAPDFLVDTVNLSFDLDEASTIVKSRLEVRRNPNKPTDNRPLMLNGRNLELLMVKIDQTVLDHTFYQIVEESLIINDVPDTFTLEIETRIHPKNNTALEGLYASGGLLCTQCEAEGFRRISYFPDRPDIMAVYTTTLVANKQQCPILLSNGNLIAKGDYTDGRHWAKWEDPYPKPSYLFALVAGQLEYKQDHFITFSNRKVTLRIYVEPENIDKCDHGLASLKQAMSWDERTYGREYDLDLFMIVAVNDFNMGAMENKGLNIFNASCVLASPETATDDDYDNIQGIIGHEYFHNWSGNRVACRDWFQLSLKEGFTVFRDQQFSADMNSPAVKRINDVNVLRIHQFREDAGPMAHPVRPDSYIEIRNFYTVTVYNKGAEVIRILYNLLGTDGFREGTDLYFLRHDGQAVTTDDFVKAMEDANGIDLTQFKNWYSYAGTPELHVSDEYDKKTKTYSLAIKQICPSIPGQAHTSPFVVPLKLGLLDQHGKDIPLQLENEDATNMPISRMLEINNFEQSYRFTNVAHKPVPSLLRGFSAPVKVVKERSDEELAFLLAHDSDDFNRWDAGQQLAVNTLLHLIDDAQRDRELILNDVVIDAYRMLLLNKKLDKALVAQALTLPSETYLAEQCQVVDVDAIHKARRFMLQQLALALHDILLSTFISNASTHAYQFNASDMAQRSLKNLCLAYLMELDDEAVLQHCQQQFTFAKNMTDVLAAITLLTNIEVTVRQQSLQAFYNRWRHDPQVINKWFAIQATSRLPDTLAEVISLTKHPDFSIKNPNNVRALIGRFCMGNPVRFHDITGAGYGFLIDQVLILNDLNPQIASRLLQTLSRWRHFAEPRKTLMQSQLQRILEHKDLSNDVYEVVAKSLNN